MRGGRWLKHVDGPWFSAVNPLRPRNVDFRLKLLETTCLPGVLSQTNRNFTWVLVVDADLDRRAKQRLEELTRRAGRVWLQEYRAGAPAGYERLGWLEPLMDGRPDFVLTTLNDDDALPRRFVETAQSHVAELAREGRLPPYKIIGNKSAVHWHMAFTRKAPLGWASPWRVRSMTVPACGFSLLCRYPAFDFSILGLQHHWAESYFDFRARPPVRNVEILRRLLLEAARDARVGRIPTNADGFFDASAAGAAVVTGSRREPDALAAYRRGGPRPPSRARRAHLPRRLHRLGRDTKLRRALRRLAPGDAPRRVRVVRPQGRAHRSPPRLDAQGVVTPVEPLKALAHRRRCRPTSGKKAFAAKEDG